MTVGGTGSWLEAVLVRAQEDGWCVQTYCTTCGSMEFRKAYWDGAAKQAGVRGRIRFARTPQELFERVSSGDRELLVRALVAGLRELPQECVRSDAYTTIIHDLYPPLILHGVLMILEDELSGTPAGEAFASMQAHARVVRAEMAARQAYESPEAVAERKRVKLEARAKAHRVRQERSLRWNEERKVLLAELSRLSPKERISRLATDRAIKLDCVPAELIPTQEGDLNDLDKTTVAALIDRIGNRKGAWRRLLQLVGAK